MKKMIMNTGVGTLPNITGCTGSCYVPRFQASIIERFSEYDVPDEKADQVGFLQTCKRFKEINNELFRF